MCNLIIPKKGDDEEETQHPSPEQGVTAMAREWKGKYTPRFPGAALHPETATR